MEVLVIGAAYGALNEEGVNCAIDVTQAVQQLVNNGSTKITIDNDTFGQGDPAKGHAKHFGMIYAVADAPTGTYQQYVVACQEGQTIQIQNSIS